jgi:hypothetical protein
MLFTYLNMDLTVALAVALCEGDHYSGSYFTKGIAKAQLFSEFWITFSG